MTTPLSRAQARAIRSALAEEQAIETAARQAARADAFVQTFINSTPAEVTAYIDSQVTDLASARNVLKKMALMLLLLARREYRE